MSRARSSFIFSTVAFSALESVFAIPAQRFSHALATPQQTQNRCLATVLRAVSGSRQAARIRGFHRLRTARDFQDAVPLVTYDRLANDIEDMKRGALHVLTHEAVLRFETSGGSSAASKYIPHTHRLLREFHHALVPWLFDIWRQRPATKHGPGYWSVSPIGQKRDTTRAGIPVGNVDDTHYFPHCVQGLLSHIIAVPGLLGALPDVASCRYVTLRCLLACPRLALISVWNPSFLTLLMQVLDQHADRLLDDLARGTCRPPAQERGDSAAQRCRQQAIAGVLSRLSFRANAERARRLGELLRTEPCLPVRALWPGLSLLSTWTDAQAARALPAVRQRFADVEIQGKGLWATEGVVTIPLYAAAAPVLAIRSHFYEFIDPNRPEARPRLAHELEHGQTYEVVISTGGGLLRYRLGDLVRVEGMMKQTPCLTFLGRADVVSDLVGEKLAANRVRQVLAQAIRQTLQGYPVLFAMLAPEWTPTPAYCLYVESNAPDVLLVDLAHRLEALLCEGHTYHYARQLGQLHAVRIMRVKDAARSYETRCIALGQRAGDVKPVDLHCDTGWISVFTGHLLEPQGESV